MNEIEQFAARTHAEGEDSGVTLVAGEEEGVEHEVAGAPAAASGISKKKKQMVMMGVGGGIILIAALAVVNLFSGAAQQPMAQYDQSPQSAPPVADQSGLVANPGTGTPVSPLIGDSLSSSPTAPAPIGNPGQAPGADPSVPISLNQMLETMPANQGAPTTQPAGAALPAQLPAPGVTPQILVPPAGPAQAAGSPPVAVQPIAPAAPAGPSMVAPSVLARPAVAPVAAPQEPPAQAAPSESVISAKEAALRTEIAKLKAENKILADKLSKQSKPQVAVAPKPRPEQQAATPAAPTQRPSVNVRANELKGVITEAPAKATPKSARGDFSIYAVTDGRVWVVGKDGERLGPLAVGSPLTDGSKITGIDVSRGVVLTNSGEIH